MGRYIQNDNFLLELYTKGLLNGRIVQRCKMSNREQLTKRKCLLTDNRQNNNLHTNQHTK
jgi:hypothetical protein